MKKQNKMYVCEECGFEYYDETWARKCGEWCKKHKSCNIETPRIQLPEFLGVLKNASYSVLDITKHAIQN